MKGIRGKRCSGPRAGHGTRNGCFVHSTICCQEHSQIAVSHHNGTSVIPHLSPLVIVCVAAEIRLLRLVGAPVKHQTPDVAGLRSAPLCIVCGCYPCLTPQRHRRRHPLGGCTIPCTASRLVSVPHTATLPVRRQHNAPHLFPSSVNTCHAPLPIGSVAATPIPHHNSTGISTHQAPIPRLTPLAIFCVTAAPKKP